MSTPSITPAQIIAALTALVSALLVLFKLHLTDEQREAFITVLGVVVPFGWMLADAIIRHGRSRALAAATAPKAAP